MGKINLNPYNNSGTIVGYVQQLNSFVNQPVNTNSDVIFNSLELNSDALIKGNLIVQGSTTVLETQNLIVEDNIIVINSSEIGSGVSQIDAGIEIERGSLDNYYFAFNETTNTFRIGEIGNTQAIATREDNPMNEGIMTWDNLNFKMVSTDIITKNITFNGSNSTSPITGSIRSLGIGVSQNLFVGGQISLSNINGSLDIVPGTSSVFLNSSDLLILNTNDVRINLSKKLYFSNILNYINFDGSDLNIVSSGNLNLQGVINLTDTTNTTESETGALTILGSIGLGGNLNIFATTQDYTFKGTNGLLKLQNNTNNLDCIFQLEPYDTITNRSTQLSLKNISTELKIMYDHILDRHIISNTNTKAIDFNEGQLYLNTNGVISSDTNISSSSEFVGSLILAGGISIYNTTDATSISSGGTFTTAGGASIAKKLFVGDKIFINSTETSSSINTGALIVSGGISSKENSYFDKSILINNWIITPSVSSLDFINPSTSYIKLKPEDSIDKTVGIILEPENLVSSEYSYDNSLDCFKLLSNKDIHFQNINTFKISSNGNLSSTGIFSITNSTTSTDTSSGALVISGGVGINENLNVGGTLSITGLISTSSISITSTIPEYSIRAKSIPDNRLFISTSGTSNLNLLGSGASNIFSIYQSGSISSDLNYSKINIGFDTDKYIITNTNSGSGLSYPLRIYNSLELSPTGIINIYNTTTSTSTTSGALVVSGGLSISNTTDATSISSGGTFTTAGGASIAKKLFVGTDLEIQNIFTLLGSSVPKILANNSVINFSADGLQTTVTLNSVNLSSTIPLYISNLSLDSIKTLGGLEIDKRTLFNDRLVLGFPNQNYTLKTDITPSAILYLEADLESQIILKNINNDYLSDNSITIQGGYTSLIEYSNLVLKYNSSEQQYEIFTDTPTRNYDLVFKNNNENQQLVLSSNGTILLGNTTTSSSITSGALVVSGGLSISNTADATSISSGGTFTTGGGASIAKKLFVGGILSILDSSNSTSLSTGSLISSGGITGKHFYYGISSNQQFRIETDNNNSLFVAQGNLDTQYIFTSLNTHSNNDNIIRINGIYGTDSEYISLGWSNIDNAYIIKNNSEGSGLYRNILLKTNLSEILMSSSGSVSLTNTTASTSTSSGSLLLSGGLSISNTTDATSISSGGTFTTGGGASIAKKLFVGSDTTLTNKVSVIETSVAESDPFSNTKGIEIISNDMLNLTYTPSLKFISNDSSFSSSKLLALITGRATENYNSSSSGGMGLEFYTTPNNPGISSNPTSRLFISDTGIVSISNNNSSSSSNSGSLVLQGSIGISNTTDASSITSGGTFTTSGGVSVAKKAYIGGNLILENTDMASSTTGSLISSGGGSFSKNLYIGGDLEIKTTSGTQNYLLTDRGAIPELNLQGLSENTDSIFNITSFDQDGTDNILLNLYGLGGTNITNTENLKIGYNYNGGNQYYSIYSLSTGTGITRPIVIQTGSNTNQIRLNTNGTITMANNTSSTSNNTGSLVLQGGLSISNSTDAISSSSGGCITVSGGVGIQSKLFVGGITTIENTTESTSLGTGSLIISGGLSLEKNFYSSGTFTLSSTSSTAFRIGPSGFGSYIYTISTSTENILTSCSTTITNTAESTNATSGSLTTLGGIGISKNAYIGGDIVLSGSTKILNMNNNRIYNLPTPILSHEATPKSYVDNAVLGFKILTPARVTTTGSNINLNAISNGSIIDGETLITGDRILVKDQTDPIENGVYLVNATPPLTRTTDAIIGTAFANKIIYISEGLIYGGTGFQCTNNSPTDIIGTDELSFIQFSSNVSPDAGLGLVRNGAVLDVNVDNSSIIIETDTIKLGSGAAGTGLSFSNSILSVNSNLSHVTGLGTITSGTWNGNTINVSHGGTGNTSFTTGNILFGNGTSSLNTSNSLFWNNSDSRLGVGTNILNSNRLTLSSGDLSIRTVTTESNGIFFENSTGDSYSASITRIDGGGSNTSHIYFRNSGSSSTVSKATLVSNTPVMILSNLNQCIINSSIIPTSTTKFAVTGNTDLSGTLSVSSNITSTSGTTSVVNLSASGTFNAGMTTPTVTPVAITNTSALSSSNVSLFSNGNYRTLRCIVSLTCTIPNTSSEFEINLPGRTTVFTNNFDLVPCIQAFVQTDLIAIQNIISIGKTISNGNLRILFQSPTVVTAKTIIFQIQVTYIAG